MPIIAMAGTPNAGKSSIFNRLTGLKQKVGNYPGVTVDRHEGVLHWEGHKARLLDLPGAYSLYPISDDERVVLRTLVAPGSPFRPDVVLFVLDAANLERGMMLLSQISDLGFKMVVGLNMTDIAELQGVAVDADRLSDRIGLPVVLVDGRTGTGLQTLRRLALEGASARSSRFAEPPAYSEKAVTSVKEEFSVQDEYAAHLIACQKGRSDVMEGDRKISWVDDEDFKPIRAEVDDKQSRLSIWKKLLAPAMSVREVERKGVTEKLDGVLTHPISGTLILMVILFFIFQAIFAWAAPMMDWIDGLFASLTVSVSATLPDSWWSDLLTDGVMAGIGGVVIFIPQIALLFGLISILEETGYMSRAVYLSDRLMASTGLNGRSLVSLVSGMACAVPAIMAARTIANRKERFITIFVTPFMSCSARLPVYVVLLAFVLPSDTTWAGFNGQGVVLFGLYLLGALTAIGVAFILKLILKSEEPSYLLLEMPRYQFPQFRNVLMTIYEKTKVFVVEAGKVILLISIFLWILSSFGPSGEFEAVEDRVQKELAMGVITPEDADDRIAAEQLEVSYVGQMGRAIEPVIRPLGFDWKVGIALITSFAAREVFVGTMATIYSAGSADDEATIIERLRSQKDEVTGALFFSPVRAISLILFYVFAMQCMSTLAVVYRETKSWSVPMVQFFAMTVMAYLASLVVWQVWS